MSEQEEIYDLIMPAYIDIPENDKEQMFIRRRYKSKKEYEDMKEFYETIRQIKINNHKMILEDLSKKRLPWDLGSSLTKINKTILD